MRPARVAELRRETVDMFYHGYDNYMRIAFPEDEVSFTRPLWSHGGFGWCETGSDRNRDRDRDRDSDHDGRRSNQVQ